MTRTVIRGALRAGDGVRTDLAVEGGRITETGSDRRPAPATGSSTRTA